MHNTKIKIIRTSTVAMSLDLLLKGQLRYLNQFYEVIALSGQDKHLAKVEKREGVKTISVVMKRKISIFHDLNALLAMYSVLKKEKPTIVHSITPKAGLITMLAAKLAGVPIRIHTFTGLIFPYKKGILQTILIYMDRLLCACATHIIPEGQGVKNDLLTYNITSKPLHIIANGNVNGIDTEYYSSAAIDEERKTQLRKELNLASNDFIFIFVGRLVKDKGINELVAAFKELNYTNIQLLLVGTFEEDLDPLLPETMKEIEANPRIISVGWQDDVRPYYAISNALAFPSYREGFPNVVMQAGAMGLPSIVTDISGSNEIIEHNINGLIINKQDQAALRNAMKEMVDNVVLYNRLKEKSKLLIHSKYEQHIVWHATKNRYETLLTKINHSTLD